METQRFVRWLVHSHKSSNLWSHIAFRCHSNAALQLTWRKKWQSTPVFLPGKFYGEEPGGLQFMGSQRVRHDWVPECIVNHKNSVVYNSTFLFISWICGVQLFLAGFGWSCLGLFICLGLSRLSGSTSDRKDNGIVADITGTVILCISYWASPGM